jgi:hypothetical protein
MPIHCPFNSIKNAISLDGRDWSQNPVDAWVYEIVVGFGPARLKISSEKHGWDSFALSRLRILREKFHDAVKDGIE